MIRAVLDPNILVSALIARDGPPGRIVRAWSEGAFEMVISPRLIAELTEVLARPKFKPQASAGRAEAFIAAIAHDAERFEDADDPPGVSPDPDDDYLLALAIAGGAEAVVSEDRHLLELEEPPVPILTARAFVERLGTTN